MFVLDDGDGVGDGTSQRAVAVPHIPTLGAIRAAIHVQDGALNTIPMGLMADGGGKLLMEKVQLRIVNSTKELLLSVRVAQAKSALVGGIRSLT